MEFTFHHVGETASTMGLARESAAGSRTGALIVLADSQIAGRGRIEGRSWSGSPSASLLFTLGLRGLDQGLPALPLRVGLAGACALRSRYPGLDIRLKWPNDLMALNKKMGGILCEFSNEWFFAGIGLNLSRAAYPDQLACKATSIDEALGREERHGYGLKARKELAFLISQALVSLLADETWKEDYEKLMWAVGEEVAFTVGHPLLGQSEGGIILGVANSGALLLKDKNGKTRSFTSGEISGLRRT
ncbi:MAG: biotin--[acetyl-CoA-carboxylase] ligase [Spirochaetes bacterium]|nr:biotin--[acetyl-CoA-carboxylase] ligase [Spirochaetota bacterium]